MNDSFSGSYVTADQLILSRVKKDGGQLDFDYLGLVDLLIIDEIGKEGQAEWQKAKFIESIDIVLRKRRKSRASIKAQPCCGVNQTTKPRMFSALQIILILMGDSFSPVATGEKSNPNREACFVQGVMGTEPGTNVGTAEDSESGRGLFREETLTGQVVASPRNEGPVA